MKKLLALVLALWPAFAWAQWQVPSGNVPIGRGDPVIGFNSVAPGSNGNCLVVAGLAWTSGACTAAVGSITGLGTGVATWLATPNSANLRGALTDETGTGLAYFQGGDIGTPSAGVGTNLTALNASNLGSGTVPAARSNGHQNGTATNDNAAAGEIGEFITNNASGVAYTSGTPFNITSVSLTAGDWDVWGYFIAGNTGTQTYSNVVSSLSATSAVQSGQQTSIFGNISGASFTLPVPMQRFSLSATTTIFLVGTFSLSAGSPATASGTINARRAR